MRATEQKMPEILAWRKIKWNGISGTKLPKMWVNLAKLSSFPPEYYGE